MTGLLRTSDRAPTRRHYAADLIHNGISVTARLVAGVGVFVVMARTMGPAAFGDFMFAMAVASLAAYVPSLGFLPMTLREVAARPHESNTLEDSIASAKLTLGALTLLMASLAWPAAGPLGPVLWLMVLAQILDGASEWLFGVQKVHGQFALEARFMTVASALHSGVLIVTALYWPHPMAIASTFAGSKGLQFLAAVVATRRVARLPRLSVPLRQQWQQVVDSKAYAADVALSVLTTQSDTVLVRLLLGSHAAGVYQAGMRVVTGLQSFSAVAGNVFLPRLAGAIDQPDVYASVVTQVNRVYAGLALGLSLALLLVGYVLTHLGYGAEFSELNTLWPPLAALLAIRVWSATYGLQLTAVGEQYFRFIVNLFAVGGTSLALWSISSTNWGLQGVVASLCASALVILALYRNRVKGRERRGC